MVRSERTYHHGNLRAALVDAALAATRDGGPEALSIREVTRQVGVSPNAAYRHFTDRHALLDAVGRAVQDRMAAQMRKGLPDATGTAVERLRAVGRGYITFALAEPGWFAVAFFGDGSPVPSQAETRIAPPYLMLVEALDGLVASGLVPDQHRDAALWSCWSAVHGFAELALRGPLHHEPPDVVAGLADAVVDSAVAGVTRAARSGG